MKTSRRFSLALAIGLGLLAEGSWAGASLEFAPVEKLLAEQPATYQWLRATLQFPDSAWAEVRLGRQFAHLGGYRLGPYSFLASRRDGTGPAEIEVIVCTRQRFLDAAGRTLSTTRQESAGAVEEHLDSVIVRDRPTKTQIPRCP